MTTGWRRYAAVLSPEEPVAGEGEAGAPKRAGSVTLRRTDDEPDARSLLDPANQSLADALRVMYGLLQAGMVVLAIVYVLSGFRYVKEGEKGIRLLFGKVQESGLEPGFQWSAPYPFGDLVKINTKGYEDVPIDKDFWVHVPPGTVDPSPDKLAPSDALKPEQDGAGYVVTADGNIAHMRWKVGYQRTDVTKYSQNILAEGEKEIVRAAVKRGVVHACSQVTIDELLKQSSDSTSVSGRAKAIAQATLDRMESGLNIDQFSLDQVIAPLFVRGDFARVQSAVSNAARVKDEAAAERTQRLNEVAGLASPFLIGETTPARRIVGLIPQYEQAIATGDVEAQRSTLAKIEAVLENRPVELSVERIGPDGTWTPVTETVTGLASGEVRVMLEDARRYQSEIVGTARSDFARFEAKLAQYRANPALMIQREWSVAMRELLAKDSVQLMLIPPGVHTSTLLLNSDPDIIKNRDRARKERENRAAEQRRLRELRETQFRTDTKLQEAPS